MTERDLTLDRRPRGAKIYDVAESAEAELRRPIADGEAHDPTRPAHDPNLATLLTISVVAVLILGLVFGLVALSSVF